MVDERRAATDGRPCLGISPPVADHEAGREIDIEVTGSCAEQPGRGLAARAAVRVIVEARVDGVERKLGTQVRMDLVHGFATLRASGNVRLVCHDDELETLALEIGECGLDAGKDLELGHIAGWIRLAFTNDRGIDHAIAVQKYGARSHGFVDSHLV
jgi:hypothetical protein